MNETYVIDGTNVCWWYGQIHPNKMSIQPLLSVIIPILENGDDFYCVFDATTTHLMDKQGEKGDSKIVEALLKDNPKRFFRVTGSTRADGVILHDADYYNRKVITNDIYRDYRDKYQWLLNKHTERLIQGNLQPSGLMTIEKLPYSSLSLQVDTKYTINRLYEMLVMREPSKQVSSNEHVDNASDTKGNEDLSRKPIQVTYRRRKVRESLIAQDSQIFRDRLKKSIIGQEIKRDELRREILTLTDKLNDGQVIISGQEIKRDELRREILTLTDKLNEKRLKLDDIQSVENSKTIKREIIDKQKSERLEVASLKEQRSQVNAELVSLKSKVGVYKAKLEKQNKVEEDRKRALQDEQVCIQKANTAINEFLDPYEEVFHFQGSSWKAAVKRCEIYFARNRVCTYCYRFSSVWEGECQSCRRGLMSDNPKALWDIIESCAPSKFSTIVGGMLGSVKNIYRVFKGK